RVGVKARVAFRARRLQQSLAFVESERLRMNAILIRHGADRVCSRLSAHSNPISTRGFVVFNFEYSRSNSFVSSEITFGHVTCTSTNWWPFAPGFLSDGAPRSRKRNFVPDCVPGGIRSCDLPSTVGTSIFAPKAASGTVIGTV